MIFRKINNNIYYKYAKNKHILKVNKNKNNQSKAKGFVLADYVKTI